MLEDYLWVEKYRPSTVEETILPVELKETFSKFVENKNAHFKTYPILKECAVNIL